MDRAYYEQYYELERGHWWFQARKDILESLLIPELQSNTDQEIRSILNAGVATGATSLLLQKYGDVTSLEYDHECSQFVREFVGIDVDEGSLTELPYQTASFDLVCAFDVIEHIEEDCQALQEIHRVLKDHGKLFLTVPAFQFLWSDHDIVNHHYRRYRLSELVKLIESMGFVVQKGSYFNFFLFPMVAAARLISRYLPKKSQQKSEFRSDFSKFQTGGLLNRVLRHIFGGEKHLLSRGVQFPFGVSAYVIAQKSGVA